MQGKIDYILLSISVADLPIKKSGSLFMKQGKYPFFLVFFLPNIFRSKPKSPDHCSYYM